VNPEDVSVLQSDGTEILTLVTCYPFYFVGSAPNRFVVRAERLQSSLKPVSTHPHLIYCHTVAKQTQKPVRDKINI